MSTWEVRSECTPRCAAHAAPRVPFTEAARRCAAFAHAAGRALRDGERMAEPARLRAHARAVLASIGVRLVVEAARDGVGLAVPYGADATPASQARPGTLVVANHISWLDIPALLAVEPVTLLAKREVGDWPLVGTLARRAGTRFIDRTGPRQLPTAVADLADLLRSGRSVAAFPQATTWCSVAHGAFRRATFQAALDAGAPVRPVTIAYEQLGMPSTVAGFLGDEEFLSSVRRVVGARGLTVRVTVHPPLLPHPGAHDRRTLAALARAAVSRTVREPVRHAPGACRVGAAPAPDQALGTYL
ncbi:MULTISPECIES: lysophospholipid acyltransferase family protein [Streptomyces]|uniref:lysophospholipid acyltransferase family protein n=1 Tax=Streptomyces TaxID=1883 RepID=UPI00067C9DC3|nr:MULTISPECIES: lysophospholipid acyltransferase family protein [Streptomyces]